MPDFKQQATDADREVDGAWFECDIVPPDVREEDDPAHPGQKRPLYVYAQLRLARWGNKRCEELEQQLIKKYRQQLRVGGQLAQAAGLEIAMQLLSETIVVEWKEVMWDGEPLLCTPENVRMLFRLPGIGRDLRDWVSNRCREREPYKLAGDEDGQGN